MQEGSGGLCVRQADGLPGAPLQRAVYRARVHHEVVTGPGVSHEELDRQQLPFHPVTARAGGDQVAEVVGPAVSQRVDVIERGVREVEGIGAIDTAAAAIAHRGALNRVLLVAYGVAPNAASVGGNAGTKNSVIVPSGQFHLAKKTTPRGGRTSHRGASRRSLFAGGDHRAVALKGDYSLLGNVGAGLA